MEEGRRGVSGKGDGKEGNGVRDCGLDTVREPDAHPRRARRGCGVRLSEESSTEIG